MSDWIRAIPQGDLARRPLGLVLGEWPIVLFRDERGAPRALLDRCPHRGVPLSLGKVRRGRLVCCYHGWEFDGAGACCHVPSSVEPTIPRALATSFEVKEAGGYVWVRPRPPES